MRAFRYSEMHFVSYYRIDDKNIFHSILRIFHSVWNVFWIDVNYNKTLNDSTEKKGDEKGEARI